MRSENKEYDALTERSASEESGPAEVARVAGTNFYIVFDGPPGPDGCRFVEVEDDTGKSHGTPTTGAEWSERVDGYWHLGPFAAVSDRTDEIMAAAEKFAGAKFPTIRSDDDE